MNIKAELSKRNISQMDVARALRVSRQMASMIVNGQRLVAIWKMKDFEKLTGIPREKFRPDLFK